jgi:hypothetical protein
MAWMGCMVPISLLAAMMLMSAVSGRMAASRSVRETRPYSSTGNTRRLKPHQLCQLNGCLQYRAVFHGAGNKMIAPAGRSRCQHHTAQGQIITLRATAGKDNFMARACSQFGNGTPRPFQGLASPPPKS